MRKIIIFMVIQLSIFTAYSQTLQFIELSSVFNNWKTSKGASLSSITNQLTKINPKWNLKSEKAEMGDEYTKSYYWTAPTEMGELQYLILSLEEDEDSFKFSLRYIMYHYGEFTKMVSELRSVKGGKFSQFTNMNGKDTYAVLVRLPDMDYNLIERNATNEKGKEFRVFTIDIDSKYLDKK